MLNTKSDLSIEVSSTSIIRVRITRKSRGETNGGEEGVYKERNGSAIRPKKKRNNSNYSLDSNSIQEHKISNSN